MEHRLARGWTGRPKCWAFLRFQINQAVMARILVLYLSCTCKNLENKSKKSGGGEVTAWWNHVMEFQNASYLPTRPDSMKLAQFTHCCNSDLATTEITHGRQRIVTGSPDEILDFIRHSQLPNAVPKLPIWYQIRATCFHNRCTWNQQFVSTTCREQTWQSVCPDDSIRGSSTTEGDAQNCSSLMVQKTRLN